MPVKMGDSLQHDECSHWTHSECLDVLKEEPDFEHCPACLGQVDASVPLLPEIEPRPDDVDYVVETKRPLMWRNPLKAEILAMLREKVPIDEIIRNYGIGLQHMLQNQIKIEDFLDNGYGLDDLLLFRDMQNRPVATLKALGTSIDHMRDYPELLPWSVLKEKAQIKPQHICQDFQLQCPEGGYVLASPKSEEWTAAHVLDLGLSLSDLCKWANLEYLEQYEALEPTAEEEIRLGTTIQQLERLKRLEKPTQTQAPLIIEHDPNRGPIFIRDAVRIIEVPVHKEEAPIRVRRTRHGIKH